MKQRLVVIGNGMAGMRTVEELLTAGNQWGQCLRIIQVRRSGRYRLKCIFARKN